MPLTTGPTLATGTDLPAASAPPVASPGQWPSHAFTVAGVGTGANPPVSEALTPGTTGVAPAGLTYPAIITRNAARVDLLASIGGAGNYAVAKGLTLSSGAGLVVNVAAGIALMDGPVELSAPTALAVPDNTARVFIWLLRSPANVQPTLAYTTTAAALPASPAVLLGAVTTSGGALTALDTSGVMRIKGGQAVRATADAGAPTDTPPADACFLALTAFGAFLWTGTAYVYLPPASQVETTITLPAQGVTLTPGENARIGVDFSGLGQFANTSYGVSVACSDPTIIVSENKGPKTRSKAFLTLYEPGMGSGAAFTLTVTLTGKGYAANPSPAAAAWDSPAAIG